MVAPRHLSCRSARYFFKSRRSALALGLAILSLAGRSNGQLLEREQQLLEREQKLLERLEHRQPLRGAVQDPCLANLATPQIIPPAVRVVQLVNCSSQTVLGAANAAGVAGQPL